MYELVNGPVVYGSLTVSTSAVEAKVGASAASERKLLGIQPLTGPVYLGFDSSVTTSNGIKIFKNQHFILELSDMASAYLISSNSVNVRIFEAS